MVHGSFFSNTGGFDLAAEWMGWENKFHCEWNPFGQKILKHYWPNAECFSDITKSDFTKYANTIDILTGSDPCQPHSFAGKGNGINDERYLWPEMFRGAKEIKPTWLVNENVEGTISNGTIDRKISDLESEGYSCWPPFIMPANAFGALHRRNRVWLVAYSERNKQQRQESCNRTVGRMGGVFKPMAWHRDWEASVNFFRRMDDGLPNIVDRTDAMRNAIVPKIAFQIFKAIEAYDHQISPLLSK